MRRRPSGYDSPFVMTATGVVFAIIAFSFLAGIVKAIFGLLTG